MMMMTKTSTSTDPSSCYHLRLFGGGPSGVAGLAVDDGVCLVLFRFPGELSGVCETVLPVE